MDIKTTIQPIVAKDLSKATIKNTVKSLKIAIDNGEIYASEAMVLAKYFEEMAKEIRSIKDLGKMLSDEKDNFGSEKFTCKGAELIQSKRKDFSYDLGAFSDEFSDRKIYMKEWAEEEKRLKELSENMSLSEMTEVCRLTGEEVTIRPPQRRYTEVWSVKLAKGEKS